MPLLAVFCWSLARSGYAQTQAEPTLAKQLASLTEAMARTQAQVERSQRELQDMRKQLTALQALAVQSGSSPSTIESILEPSPSSFPTPAPAPEPSIAMDDLRERQAVIESEIKTHEQTKVESESKYPVKITGLLLINGFVNTRQVDSAATPTLAIGGPGSTGASVRQTVLGFSARGPHLFGATSYADLNVDFDGSPQSPASTSSYTGYNASSATLLRLRTAHAGIEWQHTRAYFELDRPILSPDTPTSLTAVAQPALAWSGNLWTWNPQLGVTQNLPIRASTVRLQGALIDVGDAPSSVVTTSGATGSTPATGAERSRWPGMEARISLLGSKDDEGSHLGFGGYFSPHLDPTGGRFDAWAGTLDTKLVLPRHLSFTGSFYRGAAIGGLGAGAFKDFGYSASTTSGAYYFQPYDDVGGWGQLKEKLSQRLELNAAFGLDNVFAGQLRPYAVPNGTSYQNLARNRTYTGNVIYSPSAYLLFSIEYRHIESSPVTGLPVGSNVIGLGAGYKF